MQAYFTSYINKLTSEAEEREKRHARIVENITDEAINYKKVGICVHTCMYARMHRGKDIK